MELHQLGYHSVTLVQWNNHEYNGEDDDYYKYVLVGTEEVNDYNEDCLLKFKLDLIF